MMRVRFNSTQATWTVARHGPTEYRDGTAANKAPALSQVSGAQIETAWVEPTYHTDISVCADWLPAEQHVQYGAFNPGPRNE